MQLDTSVCIFVSILIISSQQISFVLLPKNSQSSWFRLGKAFLDESRTTHQKVDEARRWRPLPLLCPACQQLTTLHRLSYSTVCFGKVSTAFPDSSILCTLHWSAAEIQGCSFSFVGRCVHIFVRVPVKLTLFTHTKHNQNAKTLKLLETNTKITKNWWWELSRIVACGRTEQILKEKKWVWQWRDYSAVHTYRAHMYIMQYHVPFPESFCCLPGKSVTRRGLACQVLFQRRGKLEASLGSPLPAHRLPTLPNPASIWSSLPSVLLQHHRQHGHNRLYGVVILVISPSDPAKWGSLGSNLAVLAVRDPTK